MSVSRDIRREAISRLLALESRPVSTTELARRFGVTERTVYLDLAALRTLGVPLVGKPGRKGGIVLFRDYDDQDQQLTSDVVFGYEDQRCQLRNAVATASAGSPSAVLIIGDSGQGKSHLAKDLARYAQAQGFTICTGYSLERTDASPYWPWISVLERLSSTDDSRGAAPDLIKAVATLRQVLPRTRVAGSAPSMAIGTGEAYGAIRAQEAARRIIEVASQSSPLLIIIEDLHWADRSSLDLFLHTVNSTMRARLMVLGTLAPSPATAAKDQRGLARLLSSRRVSVLSLDGISEYDASRLMRAATGVTPSRSAVASAYELSGGNPFFLREISLLLNSCGGLGQLNLDQPLDIPVSVKVTIRERLKSIPTAAIAVLRIASVFGREFAEAELRRAAARMHVQNISAALDHAVAAGILNRLEGAGRLHFPHELIRQVLYDSISDSELAVHHGAVANAIEKERGDEADRHASELARHFAAARSITGVAKWAHYSVLAGLQALDLFAGEDAKKRFDEVLALPRDSIDRRDVSLAWFGLNRSLWLLGDSVGNVETLAMAFNGMLEAGDIRAATRVMIAPLGVFGYPQTEDLLERAMELVEPNSVDAAYLRINQAQNSYFSSNAHPDAGSQALNEIGQVLRFARIHNDEALELRCLGAASRINGDLIEMKVAIETSRHCLAIARVLGQLPDEAEAHYQLFRAYATLGDLRMAQSHSEAIQKTAVRLRDRSRVSQAHAAAWGMAILKADWEKAQQARCDMNRWIEDAPAGLRHGEKADTLLEAYINSLIGIEELPEEWCASVLSTDYSPLPTPSDPPQIQASLVLNLGMHRLLDSAWSVLVNAPPSDAVAAVRSMGPFHTLARNCALAAIAFERSDTASARKLYAAILPHAGAIAGVLSAPVAVDRILGLLAEVMALHETSDGHFESAILGCDTKGYTVELAFSHFCYARVLSCRPDARVRRRAIEQIELCMEAAERAGMRPLLRRASALMDQLRHERQVSLSETHQLSHREAQVLTRIAEGMTNSEIGADLFISVNTVQYHVRNILKKTGTANRAEAAVLLLTRNS